MEYSLAPPNSRANKLTKQRKGSVTSNYLAIYRNTPESAVSEQTGGQEGHGGEQAAGGS